MAICAKLARLTQVVSQGVLVRVAAGAGVGRTWGWAVAALALTLLVPLSGALTQPKSTEGRHYGVATCAGSTCHGRNVADGAIVRQNELVTWQDEASPSGAHSRAWRVLKQPRARMMATRLGLGAAHEAPACLGCHAETAPLKGERFQISDGVTCESCHGASDGWLSSHYKVGADHADNVSRGLIPLDRPKARAAVCLDCHFGGGPGQFVDHEMMAAGHPRVSFELDLFTTLQRHHDVDADYIDRKQAPGGVTTWAVGQAMALERALTLYGTAKGTQGAFPEFYFFDCHSCHRAISDAPDAPLTVIDNPGRPIPVGMPPFNDENMIMLSSAVRVAAPDLSGRFESNSRNFHAALATDRASAIAAAGRLAETSRALSTRFADRGFSRAETFAILEDVLNGGLARYTDYTGSAQAVMAADTLLNALADAGEVSRTDVTAIRPDLDAAYAAVRDPNAYRPMAFRTSLSNVATAVRRLK